MNSPFSIDLNQDQNHHNLDHFSSKITEENYPSSSSNSISYPIFNITPPPQQFPYYHSHPLHHQDEFPSAQNMYASNGGWMDHQGSVRWMSSKMRLMRKMMINSDKTVGNSSNSLHKFEDKEKGQSSSWELDDNTAKSLANNTIRVCSDCNTTKTPLWRSGPRGPKSLCNACGIRQRKARRALAAAQESGNGENFDTTNSSPIKVKSKVLKRSNTATTTTSSSTNNSHLPFKKRCKFTAQARERKNDKTLRFEDLSSVILSKSNAAFQQVFPQDEKEAAILLMALSYGLVRG